MFLIARQYTVVLLLRAMSASGGVLFPVYLGIQGSETLLGHYAIAYTLVVGLAVLIRGGLDSGFVRVLASQEYWLAKEVARSVLRKRKKWLLILPLLSITTALVLLRSGNNNLALNYALMVLSSGLIGCITIYCSFLKATGHPRLSCLFEFGSISVVALAIQICLDMFELTRGQFGLSFLFAALVLSIAVFRFLGRKKNLSGNRQVVDQLMGDLSSSSSTFLKMNIFNYLQQFSAVIVSGLVVSPSTIGAFKLIERFGSLVGFPLMAINSLFGYQYAKARGRVSLTHIYTRACLLGASTALPVLLALYILPAFSGWQSLAWMDDYLLEFSIMGLAYMLTSIFGSSGLLLNAIGLHDHQLKIMMYTGICSIPAFYIMSYWLGLKGMVLTLAVLLIGQAIWPLLVYLSTYGADNNV